MEAEVVVVAHAEEAPVGADRERDRGQDHRHDGGDPEEGGAREVLDVEPADQDDGARDQREEAEDQDRVGAGDPRKQAFDRHHPGETDGGFEPVPFIAPAGEHDRPAHQEGEPHDHHD